MNHVFVGFGLTLIFGVVVAVITLVIDGDAHFTLFLEAYFGTFNGVLAGSLIISTALLVCKTQSTIPKLIDEIFDKKELKKTDYYEHRRRFFAMGRSLSFSGTFAVVGFWIFTLAKFPLTGFAEYAMITLTCVQYALGVYVGRKLFYIAQILSAIEDLKIGYDVFKENKLSLIPTYVNSVSTLTVIFVFAHVAVYYNAPFEYASILGNSPQTMLLLPAVIARPVVALFNFYPRTVLWVLYKKAIEVRRDEIIANFSKLDISEYERLRYLIEYDRLSREEIQNRVRATLSDLPIAITIIIAIVIAIIRLIS